MRIKTEDQVPSLTELQKFLQVLVNEFHQYEKDNTL